MLVFYVNTKKLINLSKFVIKFTHLEVGQQINLTSFHYKILDHGRNKKKPNVLILYKY